MLVIFIDSQVYDLAEQSTKDKLISSYTSGGLDLPSVIGYSYTLTELRFKQRTNIMFKGVPYYINALLESYCSDRIDSNRIELVVQVFMVKE